MTAPVITKEITSPTISAAAVKERSFFISPEILYFAVSLLTISGIPLVVAVRSTKKNESAT